MSFNNVDFDSRAKARDEALKKITNSINKKGRARDRRKPGEVRSRKDSIASFCSECITSYGLDTGGNGSVLNAIRECTATECHLWPWRTGKLDTGE